MGADMAQPQAIIGSSHFLGKNPARGAAPMLRPLAAAPSRPTPRLPWYYLEDLRVDCPRAREILEEFQIGTRAGDGSGAVSAGEGSDAESLAPRSTAPPPVGGSGATGAAAAGGGPVGLGGNDSASEPSPADAASEPSPARVPI